MKDRKLKGVEERDFVGAWLEVVEVALRLRRM